MSAQKIVEGICVEFGIEIPVVEDVYHADVMHELIKPDGRVFVAYTLHIRKGRVKSYSYPFAVDPAVRVDLDTKLQQLIAEHA